jgi:soluble lytic murein transglycosylase-like protein
MSRVTHLAISLLIVGLSPNIGRSQSLPDPVLEAVIDRRLLPWQPFIEEAAQRFDMPKVWISRVVIAESAGQATLNGQPITSRAGAMGLMQVMPPTYEAMRLAYHLGGDPFDPHDNILAGTAYLRAMYDRFGYPGLFAAYNAGPSRYEASLRGVSLPAETRAYVMSVTEKVTTAPSIPALFVVLSGVSDKTKSLQHPTLFVPLHTPNSLEARPEPE